LSQTVSSVFLAYITTVATFAALMFIDFPSLEELGRLVALGMVLSAGLTLLFVPAFLSFHRSTGRDRSPRLPRLAELVERRSTAILWTAGALTMASLLVLPRLVVIASLEKIQPRTEGSAIEDEIEERFHFEKNVMLVLAQGRDLDPLLEKHRTLERELMARGETVSFSSPLVFLPPSSEQAAVSEVIESAGLTEGIVSPRFGPSRNDSRCSSIPGSGLRSTGCCSMGSVPWCHASSCAKTRGTWRRRTSIQRPNPTSRDWRVWWPPSIRRFS
jgi:hypothetical protein